MAAAEKLARKLARERGWFDLAKHVFADAIPEGEIEQPTPPAPDILVKSSDGVLGIEITQLFQADDMSLRLPARQVEGAQRGIVNEARRLFERKYGDALFVNVSFVEGAPPLQRPTAQELSDLIARHRPPPGGSFQILAGSAIARGMFPAWLQGLSIFSDVPRSQARWLGHSVWHTPTLTYELLGEAVSRKSPKADGYRGHCDRLWLLAVCDVWPMAASLSVPRDATGWRFEHCFDKVLLVSREGDGLTF